jgi:hypothetical protein
MGVVGWEPVKKELPARSALTMASPWATKEERLSGAVVTLLVPMARFERSHDEPVPMRTLEMPGVVIVRASLLSQMDCAPNRAPALKLAHPSLRSWMLSGAVSESLRSRLRNRP